MYKNEISLYSACYIFLLINRCFDNVRVCLRAWGAVCVCGACHFLRSCVHMYVVSGAHTPAVSETLGGVEAASGKRGEASEQQEAVTSPSERYSAFEQLLWESLGLVIILCHMYTLPDQNWDRMTMLPHQFFVEETGMLSEEQKFGKKKCLVNLTLCCLPDYSFSSSPLLCTVLFWYKSASVFCVNG